VVVLIEAKLCDHRGNNAFGSQGNRVSAGVARSRAGRLAQLPRPQPLTANVGWRPLLLTVSLVAAYWNSRWGQFVFDDRFSIVENRQIRALWRLAVLFPERELPTAGRPIVNVSFAINYALGGLDVRGYHAWNIAVHALCALLVFALVLRTLRSPVLRSTFDANAPQLALAVALLWGLHPLNTEVVDYLTQRTESMMALFYLLALYASARAMDGSRLSWQTIAVVSCAAGMLCKESMATAPVMIVLYDWAYRYESLASAVRNRWPFYAWLAATWLMLAAVLTSGPRAFSAGFATTVGPWTYLLNQAEMITQYLRLTVWPHALVLNYGWPQPVSAREVLPYGLTILLLLLLTIVALARRPPLGFLGAWFFITLAPTSSIVPIATEVGAERRMYLPLVALVVLGVVAVARLWDVVVARRFSSSKSAVLSGLVRSGGVVVLAVVSLLFGARTVARNREYASGLSLAKTVLERRPSSIAHQMMGTELMVVGNHEEAVAHLREAIREGMPRARFALGLELFNEGKLNEAIEQLDGFVRQNPQLLETLQARELVGRAFAAQRQWGPAAEQFTSILNVAPGNGDAHRYLADILCSQELFAQAIPHYRAYLERTPGDVAALAQLGFALAMDDKADEAMATLGRVVEREPTNAVAHRVLAALLFDRRDIPGAIAHARQAIALNPEDAIAHDVLGRALTVQGQLAAARVEFERSLQLDPSSEQAREDLRRWVALSAAQQ
jgi:protein O-mannosyl-transferase